jgi:hypothetical protein
MAARFGIEAARDCAALPPAEGESAVGSLFVKQSCVRNDPSRSIRIVLRMDYLRRPGESGVNPQMPTQLTHGEFVSSARLEIFHAAGAGPH